MYRQPDPGRAQDLNLLERRRLLPLEWLFEQIAVVLNAVTPWRLRSPCASNRLKADRTDFVYNTVFQNQGTMWLFAFPRLDANLLL